MRLTVLLWSAALFSSALSAAECTAVSGARSVPVLELYTSEGCDSCPPADRWVTALRSRYGPERLVVLAFHVDYWDKLGWIDRYAQGRFSERQRIVNSRTGNRVVYTPQLVLNGRDLRTRESFDASLAALERVAPRASIRLAVDAAPGRVAVSGAWSGGAQPAQGWIALYENRLATNVTAGENRNKRLEHDFVVRDIAGPFPAGTVAHTFKLQPDWKRADLGVAAFVQNPQSGDTLQSIALAACGAA
jgi:hypothetical protein